MRHLTLCEAAFGLSARHHMPRALPSLLRSAIMASALLGVGATDPSDQRGVGRSDVNLQPMRSLSTAPDATSNLSMILRAVGPRAAAAFRGKASARAAAAAAARAPDVPWMCCSVRRKDAPAEQLADARQLQ